MGTSFERGVVVLSIDTEQIWGYLDCLSEAQFERRFPNAPAAHMKLLARISDAGVAATWFVVGALAQRERGDQLMTGRDPKCRHTPAGSRDSASLWHCPSFLCRLREASPAQEIGIHGGLTHVVWTNAHSTGEMARELRDGITALVPLCGKPVSFSYPRNREAYHHLLPQHGIRSFRGCPPKLAWRLGRTLPGAALRALEEGFRCTPPLVQPRQMPSGLWNIPASMFLYPIGPARLRMIGLRSRVERFHRGVEAAARHRAVFHFCLHPENLVESPGGFSLLDDLMEELTRARTRGDVEVMTMTDVVDRVERKQPYVRQNHE